MSLEKVIASFMLTIAVAFINAIITSVQNPGYIYRTVDAICWLVGWLVGLCRLVVVCLVGVSLGC